MYACKIVEDNLCVQTNSRLTTFAVTYPRFVHSELMTHRMFSRNSASSRAIPNTKLTRMIEEDPVLPVWFGKNQSGMQAPEEVDEEVIEKAKKIILTQRDNALAASRELTELGLHKQIANRYVEPWMWITVLVTSSEWDNFFGLRTDKSIVQLPGDKDSILNTRGFNPKFPAQPEIQVIARMMWEMYVSYIPKEVEVGYYHTPYITDEERYVLPLDERMKISVARCARVSYLNHDGTQDPEADKKLYTRLSSAGHWSPFEHVAQAQNTGDRFGNFFGWRQYRKMFMNENIGRKMN